jgi:hypothetical protein
MAFDQRSGVRPDFIPHLENEQRRLSPQSFLKNSFRGLAADVALTRKALEEFVGTYAQDSLVGPLLVRVLAKIDLISEGKEGCEQELYKLPLSLAELESQLGAPEYQHLLLLRVLFNKFLENTLNQLLQVTSKRLPPGNAGSGPDESRLEFKIIGEGASFWALRDDKSRIVALVAKKSEADSFERLKQRYEISKFFKRHKIKDQIDCKLITSAPFLHAFFTFAPGETIREIWLRAYKSKSTDDTARLHSAARGAGEIARQVAGIKVEGLGDISIEAFKTEPIRGRECTTTTDKYFRSETTFLAPETKSQLHLDYLGLNERSFTKLRDWFKEAYIEEHMRCISHSDPHLGNWQYDGDNSSGRVAMLDLERTAIVPEPVMLGRILCVWSRWPASTEIDLGLFNSFVEGYESDANKRANLTHLAMKAAAVHMYRALIEPFWNDYTALFRVNASGISLEKRQQGALIKFRSLLKLLEDIP